MGEPMILLVEDEQITAMEIKNMIDDLDYSLIDSVDTGQEALEILEKNDADVVLMDIRLPGELDGIETTRRLKETLEDPPSVVYFSAYSDDKTLEGARNTEPAGFLIKPITAEDLRSSIEVALGPQ